MGNNNSCSISEDLSAYLIGETSEEESNFISMHLLSCPACSKEIEELREAWDMIPFQLEEVKVPSDLKEEVMKAIFPLEKPSQIPVNQIKRKEGITRFSVFRFSSYGWVAAVLFFALIGAIWNNLMLREQLLVLENQSALPTKVLQVYSLSSASPTLPAKGNAWFIEQGNKKKLVFQVQGLDHTKGSEAYQVWLIHQGNRRSAGVFRVDQQGNGYLAYEIIDEEPPFEAIGITLEPDSHGTQPRGKKVMGT